MNYYIDALKQYATFTGRATRTQYWMFVLISLLVSFAIQAAGTLLLGYKYGSDLGGLYMLAILLPSFAIAARRLHDTGRSGWWQLIVLIPIVGLIVLIVFLVLDSEAGTNKYGPNPKGMMPGASMGGEQGVAQSTEMKEEGMEKMSEESDK